MSAVNALSESSLCFSQSADHGEGHAAACSAAGYEKRKGVAHGAFETD